MKRLHLVCIILVLFGSILCNSLIAQNPTWPEFEVASVKPLPSIKIFMQEIQSGKRSIGSVGTTMNGARVDLSAALLKELIMMAYRVKTHQIVGPDWLGSHLFEIHAILPEGASKDLVPEMLQSLLSKRFKLVAHHENREQQVYALIVSPNGPKLKRQANDTAPPVAAEHRAETPSEENDGEKNVIFSADTPEGPVQIKREDRGMVISGGQNGQMRMTYGMNGAMVMEYSKMNMQQLADTLSAFMDRPVVDKTRLEDSYKVALEIPFEEMIRMAQKLTPDLANSLPPNIGGPGSLVGATPNIGGLGASTPSGRGLFDAVQKLGLKLVSQKAPVETLVIDHIEKTPTEN